VSLLNKRFILENTFNKNIKMTSNLIYRYSYPLTNIMVVLGLALLLIQPMFWTITLPVEFWLKQGFIFIIWMALFFINMRFWVPSLLFENKLKAFIFLIIAAVLVAMALEIFLNFILNLPTLLAKARESAGINFPTSSAIKFNPIFFIATLFVLGISTTIKVVQKWQKDNEVRQTLEKQKISTELSMLKAQINPHFFFNTLNSIYALTHINIEKSREALHTLSRMMRYVIYDTQNGFTSLNKEMEFLEDYVNLMKLRLTDNVKVEFKSGAYKDLQVEPMLFLPFIENAFKHGVSGIHPSAIYIEFEQQDQTVKLAVRNTLLPEKRVVLEESSGIGLSNTQRRLDLLYPSKYNLNIKEDTAGNEYQVQLTLDLS
jgi:two-component system, LytTR family, sensor kinase